MRLLLSLFISCAFAGCAQSGGQNSDSAENDSYAVVEAFPELDFERPVDLQHPGDDTNRLFVVEQRGVISVFENISSVDEMDTFLDISDQVDDSHNEEGLLGLAFHPDYEENGYFYVNYTADNPERTVIARFETSPDNPDEAVKSSETEIMSFEQPYGNHNGGQVSFGPDGYLYIATGDGGSGGDPENNGQDRTTLLGNILRVDVDNEEDGNNYAIPSDNPFVDNDEGYREEIYAYGLRNPWRFSFDPENDWLWTGDVGQNAYEEIDIIEKGSNYGWNIMEATHCFEPEEGCDESGLELPIWEYGRDEGDISVTGGFVYRGPTVTDLTGQYIYADYASGRIWALDYSDMDNPDNTELLRANFEISSFGVDQENELYICGFDGKIYRLESNS